MVHYHMHIGCIPTIQRKQQNLHLQHSGKYYSRKPAKSRCFLFKVKNILFIFIHQWQGYLGEFSLSGTSIVIEITEGLLLDGNSQVVDK